MSDETNRRDILKLLSGTALAGTAGCLGGGGGGSDGGGGDGGGSDGGGGSSWKEESDEIEFLTWQLSFLEESANGWESTFEDEYDVEAKWIDKPAEQFVQWFQSRISAGNAPHAANTPYNWYTKYATDDIWADIEKYASDDLMQTFQDRFGDSQLEFARQDGTLVGIPWYVGSDVCYYKKEWVDEAGVEMALKNDRSTQEFLSMAEQAVADSGAKYAWTTPTGAQYPWWLQWFHGWDPKIKWLKDDLSGAAFDTDATVEWLTTLRDQTEKGLVPELTWTKRKQPQYKQFASGDTVFCLASNSGFRIIQNNGDWVSRETMGISSYPNNANSYTPMYWSVSSQAGEPEKKAAVRFLEVVTNMEWSKDFLRNTTVLVGNLEANQELSQNEEFVDNNPILARLYEQFFAVQEAGNIFSPPQHEKTGELVEACHTEFTNAALGEKDPSKAVSDAAGKVDQVLG
jgi:ABC-type glycerol-3-phosphate transport system substrate-binding protein